MVKWTNPNLCLVLSESDSKLHTNLELCEGIIIDIAKTYLSTKPNNL